MDISVNEVEPQTQYPDQEPIHYTDIGIDTIMRQTTYTREEAIKLINELGSIENCIKHYLEIKPKEEPNLSTNQKIFKSIRDFI